MSIRNDLTYAARNLAREPGFTAVALLTLGLAIGANTAIFSVADALILKPLPLPQAASLMVLVRHWPTYESVAMSVPKFMFLREHTRREFVTAAAYEDLGSGFNLAGQGAPERLRGARVSADFFATLGVRPALGRDFLPEEDRPGARQVLVLSHRLWERRFGADPRILGRQLRLNGGLYTVVGVMPAGFAFPGVAELWTPSEFDPGSTQQSNYFQIVARLRQGVAAATARAMVRSLRHAYDAAYPRDLAADESFSVQPLQERLYGRTRPALLVLLAAVGAVLLIACVNIANLQLARASARQREIAIRSALGATAARIARQLLTESVLLSLAGGAVGLLLGAAAIRPLLAISPVSLDRVAQATIDGRVLAFTLALSIVSGVLFGLAPALQMARANLSGPLKEGGNRTAGSTGGQWVRRLLVAAEVALALVLITSASMLVHSFVGLLQTDAGFDPQGVMTFKMSLPASRYGSAGALARFSDAVLDRLHALPEVRQAAITPTLPLESGPDLAFAIPGRKGGGDDGSGYYDAQYRPVTAGYFQTLRIPLRSGRAFTAADRAGAPLVAIVTRKTADTCWPGQDPIGQRIVIGPPTGDAMTDRGPRTIVGVLGDVHEEGLDRDPSKVVYLPLAQLPDPMVNMFVGLLPMSLAVRTADASPALAATISRQVWAVDPDQPVTDVKTMDAVRGESLGSRRFATALLALMALLALALASLGIYGVLSYLVGQRTREIGVRLALGATGAQILRLVLRQGMGAVLAGLVAGIAGALAATRLLGGLLYGVTARDPLAFLLAPPLLALVALLASSIPAHRASQLDPLDALRDE